LIKIDRFIKKKKKNDDLSKSVLIFRIINSANFLQEGFYIEVIYIFLLCTIIVKKSKGYIISI